MNNEKPVSMWVTTIDIWFLTWLTTKNRFLIRNIWKIRRKTSSFSVNWSTNERTTKITMTTRRSLDVVLAGPVLGWLSTAASRGMTLKIIITTATIYGWKFSVRGPTNNTDIIQQWRTNNIKTLGGNILGLELYKSQYPQSNVTFCRVPWHFPYCTRFRFIVSCTRRYAGLWWWA